MSTSTLAPLTMSKPSKPAIGGGVLVEARGLSGGGSVQRGSLQSISLYARPMEMVAVAGPVGSGKALLLEILAGRVATGDGKVLLDGIDLSSHRDVFRKRIGFLSPAEAFYPNLTVQETLVEAARLRLPRTLSGDERQDRVTWVMDRLGLQDLAQVRVYELSPLDRRLLTLALEILPGPTLLVVEAPRERLDPEAEFAIAGQLRLLAEQGMTVFLETGSQSAALLADKLILLAPGGRLAWFGPPAQAFEYWRASLSTSEGPGLWVSLDSILTALADSERGSPEEWAGRYQASPAYQEYLADPLNAKRPDMLLQDQPLARLRRQTGEAQLPPLPAPASPVSQFFVFLSRGFRLLFRSRMGFLVLLAPLLAGALDFAIASPHMNDPGVGDAFWAPSALALLTFLALLAPALLFSQEQAGERAVFRADREKGLQVFPYVLAKAVMVGIFALYDGLAWGVIHFIASGFPGGALALVEFILTFALLALVGGLIGLLASALGASSPAAVGIAVALIALQVAVVGAGLISSPVPPALRLLSRAMPARYGFEGLLKASAYGHAILADPCWQLDPQTRQGLSEEQKQGCYCLGSNIFSKCDFPGVSKAYTPAVAAPEPVAPTPNNNLQFPAQPVLSPGETLDEYARAIDAYTLALEIYQGSSDTYVVSMQQYLLADAAWQRGRSLAIGSAEGQLQAAVDRFGEFFRASLPAGWAALVGFSLLLMILLVLFQRGKDSA